MQPDHLHDEMVTDLVHFRSDALNTAFTHGIQVTHWRESERVLQLDCVFNNQHKMEASSTVKWSIASATQK
jgi:hypothetical protein